MDLSPKVPTDNICAVREDGYIKCGEFESEKRGSLSNSPQFDVYGDASGVS